MNLKIVPVTQANRLEIINLKVCEHQFDFIETVEECLKEADELEIWRPVGIYHENTPIGFAMYGYFKQEGENGRVWLDRFLIDKKFQGKGYGNNSLYILVEHLKNEYSHINFNKIYLSIYETNKNALSMYKNHGFIFTKETDINGELIMVKKFNGI